MLFYSRRLRFIFIHVMKTGGTSIRVALAPHVLPVETACTRLRALLGLSRLRALLGIPEGVTDVIHTMARRGLTRLRTRLRLPTTDPLAVLHTHASAADVRAALPEKIFNQYFKFAFVRNPWDWNVSWYHYLRQSPFHPEHAFVSGVRDFEEYLTWRVEHDFHLQKTMVAGPEGELRVDFLGRFENLEEDFGKVCAAVGVQADLAHCNQSRHRDYRCYYTDRTRELVETFWAEDIEFFGYQFDPPALPGPWRQPEVRGTDALLGWQAGQGKAGDGRSHRDAA